MSVLRADAQFYLPLRGSIALQNGSGSPTFTRATAAWGFNELGKMYKVPSGAIRMRGYRPVINQYSGNTDNMSGLSTARITLIDSATSDADGTTKAGRWGLDASAGEHYLRLQSSAFEGKYVNIAFKIKLTSYRYVALRIGSWYNFYDLQTQSWNGALQGSSRDAVVSGDWVLLEMTGGPVPSGSPVFGLLFTSAALGTSWTPLGTEEVIVYQAMMSDVTGDTDKTFSDYVAGNTSYGVGANGVKYYATYKDGTPIPEANLLGARLNPSATTNNLLHCRDLTNAVWVKTNVNPTLNQTGIDGQSNACSLVEFTADGGTVLQTITAAAAAGCSGYYVKRHTGSGTIEFTRDNVNWIDITNNLTLSGFYFAKIENTSVTNPVIGFRGQNGNKIIVDAGINHLGAQICETPILTTTAAVTVNADVLTAPTASNFNDTAGTILATVTRDDWTAGNGSAVGSSTRGLYTSSANSGAQGVDGTNTVNGPSGTPSGTMRIGIRWNNSVMQTFTDSGFGTSGSYDGGFDLASIALAAGVQCTIKDVSIWPYSLTNEDITYAIKDPASIKVSFRSIAARRSRNRNLSKYFATNYAGVSMSAPNNFHGLDNPASSIYVANGGTVPNDRDFVCDIPFTGTDTETGFSTPTGSPMYATVLYGAYVIDYYNGFPTSNMVGVAAVAPITFKDVVVEGQATKALSIKLLAVDSATYNAASHSGGYRQQVWATLYRNVAAASDFTSLGFSCYVWINDLTGKLSVNNRRVTFIDMKNGHTTLGGALRRTLTIIMANSTDAAEFGVPVGTVGWETIIDNNANFTDGLTQEEFIRHKNFTVPVPQGEFFEIDFSFKKGASYSDLETGRFIVRIRTQYSSEWQTIADLYSTTVAAYETAHPLQCLFPTAGAPHAQRNIHHSVRADGTADDDMLQRIFFGQYSKRENTDFEIMFAKPRFYSGIRDL